MADSVITRFAPSPTGYLHLGGARTALFNWLFSRHHGGAFRLRIEDTDAERSTEDAKRAITEGLAWLGLDWDGDAVSQRERAGRHREAAEALLESGNAYRCYATPEEIQQAREKAQSAREPFRFRSPWRDQPPPANGGPFAVRLRAPREGKTAIEDAVQGGVSWSNAELDDLVLLRSDGTPTYMLAVVVDDHDMEISHVIRGADHLTNAARQCLVYDALGWSRPVFAHIPLIHGTDGKKLSKRHGAVGLEPYRREGYLPAAMRNYLARLGWSHGDEEFFSTEQAAEWFSLEAVGRSAARFDPQKLLNLNAQHLRAMEHGEAVKAFARHLAEERGETLNDDRREALLQFLPELMPRVRTFDELWEYSEFFLSDSRPELDDKARRALDDGGRQTLRDLTPVLTAARVWESGELEGLLREFADSRETKLGKVAQPLRAALTGRTVSPGIFSVMALLGRAETLARVSSVERP